MGWSTLGGSGPVGERVAKDLGCPVLLQEVIGGLGDGLFATVHSVVHAEGYGPLWVVSLIESGMVKHIEEPMGPYCARCSREFFEQAVATVGEPRDDAMGWAAAFRERMAA